MVTLIEAALATTPISTAEWRVVNDTVMGGVSTGSLAPTAGLAKFTGSLSLESNGGFVSIRTKPTDLELGGFAALEVTVRGDGRTWSLNAYRADVQLRAGSYRADVITERGEVTTVTVPFAEMDPTSFGRPVQGAPSLDSSPGRIVSLGFLLADKNPGVYSLEVLEVRPVDKARPRSPGHADAIVALREAVAAGVPMFNSGDVAGCRDRYGLTLQKLASNTALTDGELRIIGEALDQAHGQAPDVGAWTLRHAIDSVLAGQRR